MSVSVAPVNFSLASVAAPGTSVSPVTQMPDNCHTVIFFNPSGNVALVGRGTAGGALTVGVTAARIPAGASLTWELGTASVRGVWDQATVPGSGLIVDAVGGAVALEITYLNTFAAGAPR